jgi:hypothetical protein
MLWGHPSGARLGSALMLLLSAPFKKKTNLDKAKANQIQAKYDFIFRTKILDYYQNKPLTF